MKMDVRLLREFSGLTQTEFWGRVGVSQSGGARHEMGERRIPKPVLQLLRLVYIEKIDLDKIKREDVEVIAYLKSERKDLYKQLKKESAAHHRK